MTGNDYIITCQIEQVALEMFLARENLLLAVSLLVVVV
jgi:hypothetical protein